MSSQLVDLVSKAEMSVRAARMLAHAGMSGFAASRAYYAMFYLAEALLPAKGLAFSSHSAVISAFGHHFAMTEVLDRRFHRYLVEGFTLRQTGDYGTRTVTPDAAERTIEWAQDFLEAARAYLAPFVEIET